MSTSPQTLNTAARNGDTAKIADLLAGKTPLSQDQRNNALIVAAQNGRAECVRLLIPHSNPQALDSRALLRAAVNGHADCVTLLIPVSNPKADNSRALLEAILRGHQSCVDVLFGVSDVQHVLKKMERERLLRFGTCVLLPLEVDVHQRMEVHKVRHMLQESVRPEKKLLDPDPPPKGAANGPAIKTATDIVARKTKKKM